MIRPTATLPAEAASVPAARRIVRDAFEGLGLLAAFEAAEMLVSEVATNAVLHARTEFTIAVERTGDAVRVSVGDLSPAVPRQRRYGADATTGRGMRLVATLSAAWGVDRDANGKTVWFEVPAEVAHGPGEDGWEADADLDALLAAYEDLDTSGPQATTAVLRRVGPAVLAPAA